MVTKNKESLDSPLLIFYNPRIISNQISSKMLEETKDSNLELIDYEPWYTDFEILGNSNIIYWLSN